MSSETQLPKDGGVDYRYSKVYETWDRDGTRFRRVFTTDGEMVIVRGSDDRYVPDWRESDHE